MELENTPERIREQALINSLEKYSMELLERTSANIVSEISRTQQEINELNEKIKYLREDHRTITNEWVRRKNEGKDDIVY